MYKDTQLQAWVNEINIDYCSSQDCMCTLCTINIRSLRIYLSTNPVPDFTPLIYKWDVSGLNCTNRSWTGIFATDAKFEEWTWYRIFGPHSLTCSPQYPENENKLKNNLMSITKKIEQPVLSGIYRWP